jgi:hypothetical protein
MVYKGPFAWQLGGKDVVSTGMCAGSNCSEALISVEKLTSAGKRKSSIEERVEVQLC